MFRLLFRIIDVEFGVFSELLVLETVVRQDEAFHLHGKIKNERVVVLTGGRVSDHVLVLDENFVFSSGHTFRVNVFVGAICGQYDFGLQMYFGVFGVQLLDFCDSNLDAFAREGHIFAKTFFCW